MAVQDETDVSTSRHSRRLFSILVALIVVHVAAGAFDHGRRSGISDGLTWHWRERRTPAAVRDGPPIKPEHFRSVAELNKYLADLNEYYTVLGRPRFGKRDFVVNEDYDDGLLDDVEALSHRYRRDVSQKDQRAQQQQQQQTEH